MVGTRKAAIKLARLWNSVSLEVTPLARSTIFILEHDPCPCNPSGREKPNVWGRGVSAPRREGTRWPTATLSEPTPPSTVPPLSSGLLDPGPQVPARRAEGQGVEGVGGSQRASIRPGPGTGSPPEAWAEWAVSSTRCLVTPKRTVRTEGPTRARIPVRRRTPSARATGSPNDLPAGSAPRGGPSGTPRTHPRVARGLADDQEPALRVSDQGACLDHGQRRGLRRLHRQDVLQTKLAGAALW